jgi:hypothetical protein
MQLVKVFLQPADPIVDISSNVKAGVATITLTAWEKDSQQLPIHAYLPVWMLVLLHLGTQRDSRPKTSAWGEMAAIIDGQQAEP